MVCADHIILLYNSLDFMLLIVNILSLLVSIHDDNGHDEEANVSQEDEYHWS